MIITDYDEDNVNVFNEKLGALARNGPFKSIVNLAINGFCTIYRKLNHNLPATDVSKAHFWKSKSKAKKHDSGRCAIVATFSPNGIISQCLQDYLSSLAEITDCIVLVADNDLPSKEELLKIENTVNFAIFGSHGRFDFGSWERGISLLRRIRLYNGFKELILTNDSCYGPLYPLSNIFEDMGKRTCDFWGMCDNVDTCYHIQSYFMVFKKVVFTDKIFFNFFKNLPKRMTWADAVNCGELKFTKELSKKFKSAAYISGFCNNSRSIFAGNHNPTLWPVSTLRAGMPFLKVKALTGAYGYELHEGISDALNAVMAINPDEYRSIVGDLLVRNRFNSQDVNHLDFDPISNDISHVIENAKVISFDIFDTLLIRPYVVPTDVFIQLSLIGGDGSFVGKRIAAEKEARKKCSGEEVTLDEIYLELPETYSKYKELEMGLESRLLHANPAIKKIYEQAVDSNKKIICISDMYLSSDFLKSLLNTNGFKEIDKVYVSCEYGRNKGSRELYREVLDELQISPSDLVHFGDNVQSDVCVPRCLGIKAYEVRSILDRFTKDPANLKYLEFFAENLTLTGSRHLMMCSEHRIKTGFNLTFWGDLGYCLAGPLVLSYVQFIVKTAIERKNDALFFVARDGYLLNRVYEKYFFNEVKIRHEYVYLTRHVGLISLLEYFDEPTYVLSILKAAKKDMPEILISDSYQSNIQEYESHYEELIKWSADYKASLEKYSKLIAKDFRSIAIVDMTTGLMSSLRFAKKLLGNRISEGIFTGTFKKNEELEYTTFSSRLLTGADDPVLKLSELLVSSPEPPILAIDSSMSPIYGESAFEREVMYSEIERGIWEYCDDYFRCFDLNEPAMPFTEWFSLASDYLKYCNDADLMNFDLVFDTPGVDNSELAVKFSDVVRNSRRC